MKFLEQYLFLINKHASYKILYGGRGSGKSHQVARALIVLSTQKKLRILCTRELQKSIKDSVYKILEDIIKGDNLESFFDVQSSTIKCVNGSEFLFEGLKSNSHEIKSLEGINITWCEEAANITKESWDFLLPTVFRSENSEVWITFNPINEDDETYQRFVINKQANSIIKKVSWRDNPYFSDAMMAQLEHMKATRYNDYLHVWEGEFKPADDDALWDIQQLNSLVVEKLPEKFDYIVVAVDPAVTDSLTADETGIIVVGLGFDGLVYVIEDLSKRCSTLEWAQIAKNAYLSYNADVMIVETNQGGDLIKNNLDNLQFSYNLEEVRAGSGQTKMQRAKDINYLYNDNLVRHNIGLEVLHKQMITFTGKTGQKSPDRLDALVYALKYIAPMINDSGDIISGGPGITKKEY